MEDQILSDILYTTKYEGLNHLDFYDMIIDIWTMCSMEKNDKSPYGWNVRISKKGSENYEQLKKNSLGTTVSIIGNKNTGKSYVFSKISGYKLPIGPNVSTIGISAKIDKKNEIIYIDSAGFNSPIIGTEEFTKSIKENMKVKEFYEKVNQIYKDKQLTELFLLSFLLEYSNLLIICVENLTLSDRRILDQIRKKKRVFQKIFVVHNLYYFTSINQVKEYICEVLKNPLTFEACKVDTIQLSEEYYEKKRNRTVYVEKDKKKDDKKTVGLIHLIVASEGTEAGNYYNESTFNFIRQNVLFLKTKRLNIIDNLMNFYSDNREKYIEDFIPNWDKGIKYDESLGKIYVNSSEKISLKSYYPRKLDISEFFQAVIIPNYQYEFLKDNILILKLELPGRIIIEEIKVFLEEANNIIIIQGKKNLPDFAIIPDDFFNESKNFSNIEDGKIRFILRLPVNKFGMMKVENQVNDKIWEKKEGILRLTFQIEPKSYCEELDV